MRKKQDYLIYDTTGIEANVAENNPKFFNTKLKEAKRFAKGNESYNPYIGVYSLLPSESKTNPEIRQQYVNGHFCYAAKAAVLTNGLDKVPTHLRRKGQSGRLSGYEKIPRAEPVRRLRSITRSRGCKPKDLIGIPWMLAFALRDEGWYLRNDIIWMKEKSHARKLQRPLFPLL